MARGRQQKWICRDCKAEFQVQNSTPRFCCACGSDNIARALSGDLSESYEKKRLELEEVCAELAPVEKKYLELKKRYSELMSYWRQQKKRGYISAEEYEELASLYVPETDSHEPNTAITAKDST